MLASHCLECHHPGDAQGGLDLTTADQAAIGGDSGSAWDRERPEQSRLLARVRDGEMPPDRPLEPELVAAFAEALSVDRPWPTEPIDRLALTTDRRAGRDWWSLAPLASVAVPEGDAEHPIDRFLDQELRRRGLEPLGQAEPRVLVRRLYHDLLGLPPTYEEVREFEADPSDEAWERLVDRLLDDPARAERSAQHWLDVVRFGESNGFEYNEPRYGAWPYRDWVIRAFERDLPYDEFARAQIAGDLLGDSTDEDAIAVGFLVAGIRNTVIGQSPTMRIAARQAELEEIAAVTSQAFLGLTVQCARCHDHKFDPIRTDEYYRFIAALDGIRHGTRSLPAPIPDDERHRSVARRVELLDRLDASMRQRGEAISDSANSVELRSPIDAARRDFAYRVRVMIAPTVWAGASQGTDVGDGLRIEIRRPDGSILTSAVLRPGPWQGRSDDVAFAEQEFGYVGDGSEAVTIVIGSARHEGRFGGAIARLTIDGIGDGDGSAPVFDETFDDLQGETPVGAQAETGLPVRFGLTSERWIGRGLNAIHAVELPDGHRAVQIFGGSIDRPYEPADDQERAWLDEAQAIHERLRPLEIHTVVPSQPEPMRILQRGEPTLPGAIVAPGGLEAITGPSADWGLDVDASDADRRRALAEWIAHDENGPFDRVAVNRIWQQCFGIGLVETPSDLGWSGGRPSHPALLEWLAYRFRDQGRSIRRLQRLILTSRAYRRASYEASERYAAGQRRDADARTLWRQRPRRIDAEALRDGMLAIAGRLDRTRFGPGYRDVEIETVGAAHDYRPIDSLAERRTLYRWRVRGERDSLLETFDCPDPSVASPVRNVTTTPTQALSLWNHPFVARMADATAASIEASDRRGTIEARVRSAWRRVLQREPNDTELRAGVETVAARDLASLCRVLLNLTETVVIE